MIYLYIFCIILGGLGLQIFAFGSSKRRATEGYHVCQNYSKNKVQMEPKQPITATIDGTLIMLF